VQENLEKKEDEKEMEKDLEKFENLQEGANLIFKEHDL
jgi:hypothetical protein